MFGSTPAPAHPILGCAQAIYTALSEVAEVDPIYMSPDDKATALLGLQRDLDRLAELQLRILATAEDVAAQDASRDPAAWLAFRARLDRGDARHRQGLARSLEAKYHRLTEALRAGVVTLAQAHVIARALDDLPEDLAPDVGERAEKQLIDYAGDYTPKQLRRLGRRILEVVDPEGADEHEQRKLEDEERSARKRTWLRFQNQGDGTTTIRGRIPSTLADRFRTYLEAYTSPRHPTSPTATGASTGSASGCETAADTGPARPTSPDLAPYDARMGRAFGSLLEHWDPSRMPIHGGGATTVIVKIDFETLRDGLGTATTDTGEKITADEARRLACTAGLMPAVFGKDSELLDLGRTARLYSPAQRKVMALRDITCRAQGCDIPATWCEAHHLRPWSQGGRTDLTDGVLLCPWHHHRTHDPAYHHQRLPDGAFRYHRRT